MNSRIARQFEVSRTGVPAGEIKLPAPERGTAGLQAVFSQNQLALNRDVEGDILEVTMAMTYNIVPLSYTVTAILQTCADRAAVAVQLICQVDSKGVPITPQRLEQVAQLSVEEKKAFLADTREGRQWSHVESVDLNVSPTYAWLLYRIREVLPTLYAQMSDRPEGGEQPFEAMRRLLILEEVPA